MKNELTKGEKDFASNLAKLTKSELVDYIFLYWLGLTNEAINKLEGGDKDEFEIGRIQLRESNKMRNILLIKSTNH